MSGLRLLFHVHTRASFDSLMSPRTVLHYCRRHSIDAVAVCDHDSLAGSRRAVELAASYGVTVLPAVEIATDCGDVIGLFIDSMPPQRDIDSVLGFIKARHGGLAVLPHPLRGHDLARIPIDRFDLIETGNARCSAADNAAAAELAETCGKPRICGADAHVAAEMGLAINVFPRDAFAPLPLGFGDSSDADWTQWRRALLDAPRQMRVGRSPARYRAMSGIVKGVRQRQLGTMTNACRRLLREERNRRLWRFAQKDGGA